MEISKPDRSTVAGDTWRDDLATLLSMETMYSHATWFDALGVIEAWDDREEVAQTLARMSMWLYPPSFARVLASRRGSY